MKKLLILGGLFILVLIAFGVWFWQQSQGGLNVSAVTPVNNAKDVPIYPAISVSFSRPLTEAERKTVKIAAAPFITAKYVWSGDNKVLLGQMQEPLLTTEQYELTVSYTNKKYTWRFETVTPENVSLDDANKAQVQADYNFGQWQDEVDSTYPWLDKLPIQTANYFFYFDIDKKSFIGNVYPQQNSTVSLDTQTNQYKTAALNQARSLQIPVDKYPIEWVVTPE